MIKKFISPYMKNAFSKDVLYMVILSEIDFELPDIE